MPGGDQRAWSTAFCTDSRRTRPSANAGREIGAIADRRDRRVAGRQILVDDDAVLDREPGVAGEFGIGHDPDADQDKIGRQHPAVAGLDAR